MCWHECLAAQGAAHQLDHFAGQMRQIAERLVLYLVAVAIASAEQMGDVFAALILPPRSDDVNCSASLCHEANQSADLPTMSIHFSDYIMRRGKPPLLPSTGSQLVRYDTGSQGELQAAATGLAAAGAAKPRSVAICSMARSARAVMVRSGLAPSERGMIAPSMT